MTVRACYTVVSLLLVFRCAKAFPVSPHSAKRVTALLARNSKKPRFSQEAHSQPPKKHVNNKKKKSDVMWQSNKSIEDLEATMTKRWGTALDKWTADPNEYEVVDDASNGNAGVFRAKPVLDPWQKDEEQVLKESGGDDVVMNRVRRNQERMQKERKEEPVVEFYDEDDEGYEPSDHKSTEEGENEVYRLNHLISPRPVGGRGTSSVPDKQNDGGFFFKDVASTDSVDTEIAEEGATKKRRRSKSASVPVLDENGNPMLLTLKQAERDFQSSLLSIDEDGNEISPPETRSWEELGITSDTLLMNLEAMGCASPLAVQDKACPAIVTCNDALIGTYTGSGKTLAFLVPLAQRLLFSGSSSSDVQVIIIAPGRELASQIVSVARILLEGTGLTAMLAIGGTTFSRNLEQIRKRKPSIVVGTPGRIAELVIGRPGEKSGRLKVGDLQALVLDEFDALLEYKPHRDPTNAIISSLKKRHGNSLQSILCSATASDMMGSKKLEQYLRPGFAQAMADKNDQLITSGDDASSTRVSSTVIHGVIHVPHRRLSLETLRSILHTEPFPQQVLIFVDTARRVDIVIEKLSNMGIVAAPLHGGFGSEKVDRAEVSKALREGYVGIVVATELAARGLDAPLLTHVINLDLPTDASHYAHRAGRCGRGGRPGVVINVTTNPKERNVPQRFADNLGITMHTVEARAGKLSIVEADPHLDENL